MSQHLPIGIARPVSRQWILPRSAVRPFSATVVACGKKGSRQRQVDPRTARLLARQDDSKKAPATTRAEALQDSGSSGIPDDLGLLSGTFIREWGAAPPLLPFADRWKYETAYLKRKLGDIWTMLYFKWWVRKGAWRTKPREVFDHRHVRRIARENYVALYEALASKDDRRLESFCLSGLQSDVRSRIESRPNHVEMIWKLLDVERRPRIMSNRFTVYPMPGSSDRNAPSCFRQVVVRLKTRQLLTIERKGVAETVTRSIGKGKRKRLAWSPDGLAEATKEDGETQLDLQHFEKHEQDVVEYVVLQRRMIKGVEEEWKMWGFADKTSLQRVLEDEEEQEAQSRYAKAHPGMA